MGLSEIIATPVFYKDRVYVAIGRDPDHGRGRGALVCLDAGQMGDCTRTTKLWTYQGLDRSLSTVSIAEGLLYIADVAGRLHCLDAETGQLHWVYESKGARSPRPSWPMERSTWPTKSTWTCWRRARQCDFEPGLTRGPVVVNARGRRRNAVCRVEALLVGGAEQRLYRR